MKKYKFIFSIMVSGSLSSAIANNQYFQNYSKVCPVISKGDINKLCVAGINVSSQDSTLYPNANCREVGKRKLVSRIFEGKSSYQGALSPDGRACNYTVHPHGKEEIISFQVSFNDSGINPRELPSKAGKIFGRGINGLNDDFSNVQDAPAGLKFKNNSEDDDFSNVQDAPAGLKFKNNSEDKENGMVCLPAGKFKELTRRNAQNNLNINTDLQNYRNKYNGVLPPSDLPPPLSLPIDAQAAPARPARPAPQLPSYSNIEVQQNGAISQNSDDVMASIPPAPPPPALSSGMGNQFKPSDFLGQIQAGRQLKHVDESARKPHDGLNPLQHQMQQALQNRRAAIEGSNDSNFNNDADDWN